MMLRRAVCFGILATVVFGLSADRAFARIWVGGSGVRGGWYGGGGHGKHGKYNDSASSDTSVGSSTEVAANDPNNGMDSQATTGNDEAARAAAAMDVAQRQVDAKFESSPEWTEASTAFDEAKAAVEKARARVMAALAKDARYQAAVHACEAAADALSALRANGAAATSEQMVQASAAALQTRSAVAQMESAACANDPALTASAAKLKDVAIAMVQLRQQERAAVTADAAWQSAQQTYQRAMGATASARVTTSDRLR